MQKWEEIEAKLAKLNQFVKKNQDFVRIYKMGIKSVEVDANGRIQLPKELVAFAGITKEIVLAPSIGMLEIWDKAQYESVDRKSTRLNSSHVAISYAVFCLKK